MSILIARDYPDLGCVSDRLRQIFSQSELLPRSAVMPTLPLLAGDLRFFALSPALPLWYINLPLFKSTTNIEYVIAVVILEAKWRSL